MDEILELEDVEQLFKLFGEKCEGELVCVSPVTETFEKSDVAKVKIVITCKQDNTLIKITELLGDCKFMLPDTEEYKNINDKRKFIIESLSEKSEKRKIELYDLLTKKGFKVLFGGWS